MNRDEIDHTENYTIFPYLNDIIIKFRDTWVYGMDDINFSEDKEFDQDTICVHLTGVQVVRLLCVTFQVLNIMLKVGCGSTFDLKKIKTQPGSTTYQ
jgi:hypothetical protein